MGVPGEVAPVDPDQVAPPIVAGGGGVGWRRWGRRVWEMGEENEAAGYMKKGCWLMESNAM